MSNDSSKNTPDPAELTDDISEPKEPKPDISTSVQKPLEVYDAALDIWHKVGGDVLVGLTGNFEGMLVGFLERSIWTVSGSGQIVGDVVDWTRRRSNAQIGCVSGRSVVRIPGGAKYSDEEGNAQKTGQATLAYVTPIGDIRILLDSSTFS